MNEPTIVERAESHVLGVLNRINPTEADYGDLWENQYMPRHKEIDAVSVESGHYGVYFACEPEGVADFISGMAVAKGTEAPEGLTVRAVPAGPYAAFECTMGTIGPTWGAIYGEWLPASEFVEDEARPSIEYYPPETKDEQSPVTILIPVVRK